MLVNGLEMATVLRPCMGFPFSQKWITGILLLISLLQCAQASWWYLGLPISSDIISDKISQGSSKETCDDLKFLEPYQREICNADVQILKAVGRGAEMAIRECQAHFKGKRWNCPTYNDTDVFGAISRIKTYESAFVHAITSAGVTYAVTKACARGELKDCGCDPNPEIDDTDAVVGGCSDDVRYGARFSSRFLDTMEQGKTSRSRMNLWNNAVGRKIVKDNMKLKCKCHGKSCSIKSCWMKMQSFRYVSKSLTRHAARQVLGDGHFTGIGVSKRNLAYLKTSPSFCNYDPKLGSLGTRGRQCNATVEGRGGCTYLCCHHGYQNVVEEVKTQCNCTFHWCCRLQCDTCVEKVENTYCN